MRYSRRPTYGTPVAYLWGQHVPRVASLGWRLGLPLLKNPTGIHNLQCSAQYRSSHQKGNIGTSATQGFQLSNTNHEGKPFLENEKNGLDFTDLYEASWKV